MVNIGSKYYQMRSKLRDDILEMTTRIFILEENIIPHQCYFCRNKIQGEVFMIEDSDDLNNSFFPIDERCLSMAQRHFYVNDIPYAIN
jgi:hypothetical protein